MMMETNLTTSIAKRKVLTNKRKQGNVELAFVNHAMAMNNFLKI